MRDYGVDDYRVERWAGAKQYYVYYAYCGGCDPAYSSLSMIADGLGMGFEERVWLAFLYGSTYCDATTLAIWQMLPLEEANLESAGKFWEEHKPGLLFVSDRRYVKNMNHFPKMVGSYADLLVDCDYQNVKSIVYSELSPSQKYEKLYDLLDNLWFFGRFSLFNLIEALGAMLRVKLRPSMDLRNAESARNGLCYAMGLDDQVTLHHKPSEAPIDYDLLDAGLCGFEVELQFDNPEIDVDLFSVETALCGYKKLYWETRYLGYYVDRHCKGIKIAQDNFPELVFDPLWDFRSTHIHPFFRIEDDGMYDIRKDRLNIFNKYGTLVYPQERIPSDMTLLPHLREGFYDV